MDKLSELADFDQAYCHIRGLLITGEGPSFDMSSRELASFSQLDEKAATQVVMSLFADRYFGGKRHIQKGFLTNARLMDWLSILSALVSAAASCRHLWREGEDADRLQEAINRYLDTDPASEASLVAMIEVLTLLFSMTAPSPNYDTRPDLVAPAMLRLAWAADHGHDCLLKGFRLVGKGFSDGCPIDIRTANTEMWTAIAEEIADFLDARASGRPLSRRAYLSTLREPSLSGKVRTSLPTERERVINDL